MTLRAGAAHVDITPPNGYPFSSWGLRTGVAVGIHDPLLAQALVLDDGERTVAIVAVDLGNVAREFTDDVRRRVQALTGIAPEAVLINASHNHSGPPGVPRRSGVSLGQRRPRLRRLRRCPARSRGRRRLLGLVPPPAGADRRRDRAGSRASRSTASTATTPKDEQVGVLRVDAEDGEPIAKVARSPATAPAWPARRCSGTPTSRRRYATRSTASGPARRSSSRAALATSRRGTSGSGTTRRSGTPTRTATSLGRGSGPRCCASCPLSRPTGRRSTRLHVAHAPDRAPQACLGRRRA